MSENEKMTETEKLMKAVEAAEEKIDVERHIKYTKKIKLNARRHNVKFRSIQII